MIKMSKPFYVKIDVPQELVDASYEALRQAKQTGKIRKGTNESTKAVERGTAKLVVISEDVDPPEVVAHLPILCDEMKIPYVFVPNKQQIGNAIGIDIGASVACIVDAGEDQGMLEKIIEKVSKLKD